VRQHERLHVEHTIIATEQHKIATEQLNLTGISIFIIDIIIVIIIIIIFIFIFIIMRTNRDLTLKADHVNFTLF
jgi:ABC-type uncharacterized transport system permease subunit